MEHYLNFSLENLTEEIEGILYIEEWRDIPGYEGLYQASSFGRLKSVEKLIKCGPLGHTLRREKILKVTKSNTGYLQTRISKNGVGRSFRIHRLITNTFIGGRDDLPIDHKNRIKTDNRVMNLEYVTHRENVHRFIKSKKGDLPIGVSKERNGFMSQINYNKKHYRLGVFPTIEKAHAQYEMAINDLENIHKYVLPPRKSKYGKGIQYRNGKYCAEAYVNKIKKYLGAFDTKEEAEQARMAARTNQQY